MKLKQYLTAAVLALTLAGGMVAQVLLPDREVSKAERRKLNQMPAFEMEALLSGEYASDLETYLLDQFPMRDGFRTIKSIWSYYILNQQDNNGIFIEQDTVSKLNGDLDRKQVQMFVDKMNALHDAHFPDSEVTCVVIPDKNYYLTDGKHYPRFDYETLFSMVREGLPWADYVDITGGLDGDLYYTTDSHWRQEHLLGVRDQLAAAMKLELPAWDSYRQTVLPGFYGVYHGQAALPLPAEDLVYLENDVTDSAVVTGPELKGEQSVYAPERFQGIDGYDVFLHGAQSVLTVENPLAKTDRELIVFRDSFGSSITPLLLPGYKTVTLVDTRYINPSLLDRFVDFHGQEVLILYSATMINKAAALQ